MNFVRFPIGTTNIFPVANSTTGGQLMTEYNLRSKEYVETDSSIQYFVGRSFLHSPRDFMVDVQKDELGSTMSNSTLTISEGVGVVNGHYFESLTPVTIDLLEANTEAKKNGLAPLKGKLAVGLRAMYSTEPTMAGSMQVGDATMVLGVQVVILPEADMKTPKDVPTDPGKITAHIRLATFSYVNGIITSIKNNFSDKYTFITADRVGGIADVISDSYLTKHGLNPKKLYTFSGKGTDPASGKDTWCDSTDSLIVWDADPRLTTNEPTGSAASFATTTSGKVQMYLPHKQVDGMVDANGRKQYYAAKIIDLPTADFNSNTSGVVDTTYTKHIKQLGESLNNFKRLTNGRQVAYIDILDGNNSLPPINTNWNVGDYILVGQDSTVSSGIDTNRSPSTLYLVQPGIVTKVKFLSKVSGSSTVPSSLTGVQLGSEDMSYQDGEVNTSDSDSYNSYWGISSGTYRGEVDKDYFVINYTNADDSIDRYYYTVSVSEERSYTDPPVFVTGEIPYATEETIGGFKNVAETTTDGGYVYRDDNGHLRLIDYTLLRSGTLAYQLGEDVTIASGTTVSDIQAQLDEYVNQRIAFPNLNQTQKASEPNVINITFDLPEDDGSENNMINIYDIDSRFGASVYIHINGSATSNTVVNIANCEKVRIDNNIGGSPTVNLYRSTLYYDADILNTLSTIQDMKLWYEKFDTSDPDLVVDNMTVREIDAPIITTEMDYWSTKVVNDNHFLYGLQSVTFGSDGTIIGCGMYIRNESSANIDDGTSIISSKFTLPQGSGLNYPVSRLTKQMKISGSFITAYENNDPVGYKVLDTKFTALTNVYDPYNTTSSISGVISFYVIASNVEHALVESALDTWDSNSFNVFTGGVVG